MILIQSNIEYIRVLSYLERDFPVSLHVIVFHLFHHMPMFLRRFGPAYGFWMYPMERFNRWICARITNRRHPESTVLESYRFFELAFFMQLSGKLPQCVTTTDLADVHVAEPSEQYWLSYSQSSSEYGLMDFIGHMLYLEWVNTICT